MSTNLPNKILPTWRNSWVEHAWKRDTTALSRWFILVTAVEFVGRRIVLLRRVIGWDNSQPPKWLKNSQCGRIVTTLEERTSSSFFELLDVPVRQAVALSTAEVRRLELPVIDWQGGISADIWCLRLPLAVYEVWALADDYRHARDAWNELNDEEQRATNIQINCLGHLASTIVVAPQLRPFLTGIHDLVIPGGPELWGELQLVSEVLDGSMVLSRTSLPLLPEPLRDLDANEKLEYIRLHFPSGTFAAMSNAVGNGDAIAPYPDDAHGHSGSDWRVTIISSGGTCDSVSIGLIRGIGNCYMTKEPWRDRYPEIGFSAPARVNHVPPSQDAADEVFRTLLSVGGPAWLCDPYAEINSLSRLSSILEGGHVLTRSKNADLIDSAWAREHGVTIRSAPKLHDRFLIGPKGALLIGFSINSIGKTHCFITQLDNTMRVQITYIFEELWRQANDK